MTRLLQRLAELKVATGASTSCGWMIDELAILLYALVKFHKPDIVIQAGHLWGKSALVILEALTDGMVLETERQNADRKFTAFVELSRPINISTPTLISVDPIMEGVPSPRAGLDLLRDWYPANFSFECQRSNEFFRWAINTLYIADQRIMALIDGDHAPQACLNDLQACAQLHASPILLDDIDWLPHINELGQQFANDHAYLYTPLHLYNGLAILTKK